MKNSRSREQIVPSPQLPDCSHGDVSTECSHGAVSEAPPTNQEKSSRERRKRGRRRERRGGGGGEKKKKTVLHCESSEGQGWNGMETDEPGMETVEGMEAWQEMGVPLPIIRAMKELGFTSPTEIQRRAIPVAMDTNRDIIGAAETVSPYRRSASFYFCVICGYC